MFLRESRRRRIYGADVTDERVQRIQLLEGSRSKTLDSSGEGETIEMVDLSSARRTAARQVEVVIEGGDDASSSRDDAAGVGTLNDHAEPAHTPRPQSLDFIDLGHGSCSTFEESSDSASSSVQNSPSPPPRRRTPLLVAIDGQVCL